MVSFPPNRESLDKIDAIVNNVTNSSFGVSHYPSIEQKVVAYFYFLIKDHPFIDGNKRTATLVFSVLCIKNGLHQHLENYQLDSLAVFIEQIPPEDYKLAIKIIANTVLKDNSK